MGNKPIFCPSPRRDHPAKHCDQTRQGKKMENTEPIEIHDEKRTKIQRQHTDYIGITDLLMCESALSSKDDHSPK